MEREEFHLLIPGPTPVPPRLLRAQSRPMINHRGPTFAGLLRRCLEGLQYAFQTRNEVILLTASGTGGLEAALVNTLSPGDRVLAVTIGAFGERFADIAEAYGAEVVRLAYEWGKAARPEDVRERLAHPGGRPFKAVLLTHNETSTGVTNDVRSLAQVAREFEALVLVDAISGLVAIELPTDAWDLDVVVAGSQKAFMIPPGLSFVSVGPRGWAAYGQARMPRFYWDFEKARRSQERGENPFTPAVSLMYALEEALEMIRQETLEGCQARHRRLAGAVRAGLRALGCEILAEPGFESNSVTAFRPPEGISPDRLRAYVLERFRVVLADGQGPLKGKIARFGHLGYVGEEEILLGLQALERGLRALGAKVSSQGMMEAVEEALAREEGSHE